MWSYLQNVYHWWHPQTQQNIVLTPLQNLRKLLQLALYENQLLQKICMYYAQLVENYKQQIFQVTTLQPIFTNNSNANNLLYVSIVSNIKIQTEKAKCKLKLVFYFHQKQKNAIPQVYIQNFQSQKMKPNPKYRQYYEHVTGGVLVNQNFLEAQFKWGTYNSKDLVNLYKNIKKLIQTYFPFVKKTSAHKQTQNSNLHQRLLLLLRNQNQLLQNIQNLTIINYAIPIQINILKQENKKIKEQIEKADDNNSIKISKMVYCQGISQTMLDLVSQDLALQDSLRQLEEIFKKQKQPKIKEYLQILKEFSERSFEVRFKIQKVKKIFQNSNNFQQQF